MLLNLSSSTTSFNLGLQSNCSNWHKLHTKHSRRRDRLRRFMLSMNSKIKKIKKSLILSWLTKSKKNKVSFIIYWLRCPLDLEEIYSNFLKMISATNSKPCPNLKKNRQDSTMRSRSGKPSIKNSKREDHTKKWWIFFATTHQCSSTNWKKSKSNYFLLFNRPWIMSDLSITQLFI